MKHHFLVIQTDHYFDYFECETDVFDKIIKEIRNTPFGHERVSAGIAYFDLLHTTRTVFKANDFLVNVVCKHIFQKYIDLLEIVLITSKRINTSYIINKSTF